MDFVILNCLYGVVSLGVMGKWVRFAGRCGLRWGCPGMCSVDSQIDRGESFFGPPITNLVYSIIYHEITKKWVRFAFVGWITLLPWRAVPQQAVGYRVERRQMSRGCGKSAPPIRGFSILPLLWDCPLSCLSPDNIRDQILAQEYPDQPVFFGNEHAS